MYPANFHPIVGVQEYSGQSFLNNFRNPGANKMCALLFFLGILIGAIISCVLTALLCANNRDLEKENLQSYCEWLENEVRRLGGDC